MDEVGTDTRLEIVMDEALRALDHQHTSLESLRGRATLLTTAAALVASFFGSPMIGGGDLRWTSVVAVVSLIGVLACTLIICGPWWKWHFRSSAGALLGATDAGHSVDSMRRHLSKSFEDWHDRNEARIRVLQWWFIAGLVLLMTELLALMLQFGGLGG
jgi:hypothetical protein